MIDSFETSAVAACAAIRQRDVGAQDLTSRFLARISARNGQIGAVTDVLAAQALQAARALDARLEAGETLPPLAGLPVVVKENCDTAGAVCSAGLDFRRDHRPVTDSWVSQRLRDEGAIILGVAASDPGAFSVRTPQVTHPLDPLLTVGGSSGGSAAALAADFCLGAIGTDTGGSIRIPAACCGMVGLKPTFGTLPMEGIFPLVQSLDHVGPMARSVADVRLMWEALKGVSASSAPMPRRIGYDPAWLKIADRQIRDAHMLALDRLVNAGVEIAEIRLPDLDETVQLHGRIFLVEAEKYHRGHHGAQIDAYPAIAREWFEAAKSISPETYRNDLARRAAMTALVDDVLRDVDAVIAPTLPVVRPEKTADTVSIAGIAQDFTMGLVKLTCLFDHTGHPVLSLPFSGAPDRLASSVQLIGRKSGEGEILLLGQLLDS